MLVANSSLGCERPHFGDANILGARLKGNKMQWSNYK